VLIRLCDSWEEAFARAGLTPPAADAALDDARRELVLRFDVGDVSYDHWAESLARVFDGAYSADELKAMHRALTRDERPGTARLIADLHDAGIVTGCLSNTNAAHWARLIHHDGSEPLAGTPEYPCIPQLQHHVASHLVRSAKPDAPIYEHFERLVGARGDQILFFDDREENIVAARARGWRAEHIDPHGDTVAQMRKRLRDEGVALPV
jgi:FMN phosphatase YigB (HAD superfamily)